MIPAHPLAVTASRTLDARRQRALTRYYLDAGAGGLAVGVHTTQFAIHEPKRGLLEPVLQLAIESARGWSKAGRGAVMIAGAVGRTRQAVHEAQLARDLGYDAVLLSLGGMAGVSDDLLLTHCRVVAGAMPLVGFYLQPAVGGRLLDYRFWRRFCDIENVVAIKVAPFDRYATLDVIRAVADSGRARGISVYTGNDDHIILDLLTRYEIGRARVNMVGGLLGHWAFWTRAAAAYHRKCRALALASSPVPQSLIRLAAQVTDANAAVFDVANQFAGCIPGIHEVLRRAGLLANRFCLDDREDLSRGQLEEIDRIWQAYPKLRDDDFVAQNLSRWMA